MHPDSLSQEQYYAWLAEYSAILKSMRFKFPLDREKDMLYLLERILLRVRLSVGLGEPGVNLKPNEDPLDEEESEDPYTQYPFGP